MIEILLVALLLLGAAVVLAYVHIGLRYVRTAVVVVHPWDLGFAAGDVRNTVAALGASRFLSSDKLASLEKQYREYCHRLAKVLRWAWGRYIILVDYEPHETQSLNLLTTLLLPLPRIIATLSSKPGRPELVGTTWAEVAKLLSSSGVRKVVVMGCFYGEKDGEPVDFDIAPFCVNFTIKCLRETKTFASVVPNLAGCFVHEV